jgi:hypothetical protein
MHETHMQRYILYQKNLNLDLDMAGYVLMATGPEPNVLDLDLAYMQVFYKAVFESMLYPGAQELAMEAPNGIQPVWGSIYNLIKKEVTIFKYC